MIYLAVKIMIDYLDYLIDECLTVSITIYFSFSEFIVISCSILVYDFFVLSNKCLQLLRHMTCVKNRIAVECIQVNITSAHLRLCRLCDTIDAGSSFTWTHVHGRMTKIFHFNTDV